MKRKSLTLAWERSLFSIKKLKLMGRSCNLPNEAAEGEQEAAQQEAAQEAAEAAEGAEAAA
jgi:hypothetical protein